MYTPTTKVELDKIVKTAQTAFMEFKNISIKERAQLMRKIASAIENMGDEVIEVAHQETHLSLDRLNGERGRTVFQWRNYADALEFGHVLNCSIDTADASRVPPKPDIRKTMIPLGPVVIFGASNFPFAFSTAGGDTASAFAAGNPVVVKAHPAHAHTATLMGKVISKTLNQAGLSEGIFSQVYGKEEVGQYLVQHPGVFAVGFTGSFSGGKALFDFANKREVPIPVFAEMGSINPVFLLANKLKEEPKEMAAQYVQSLTLGVGQFCTNPGVLMISKGEGMDVFLDEIKQLVKEVAAQNMLHIGISTNYKERNKLFGEQAGVEVFAQGEPGKEGQGEAIVAKVSATDFIKSPLLFSEVFGPFGLIVLCEDYHQMEEAAKKLPGQLTGTFLADEQDLATNEVLISIVQNKCGRLLVNNFPTGVEVCLSMQHGGPYPASTDSRFTSVGADAIRRFMRPVTFQNWPNSLLPLELQDQNILQIKRIVNNTFSTLPI